MSLLGVKRTWKSLPTAPSANPGTSHRIDRSYCALIFFRAAGGDLTQPVNELGVTATIIDQALHLIATVAAALGTGHAQAIELAEQITEYDCAVAGHGAVSSFSGGLFANGLVS